MAREIPESDVATMEALVKCGVVMVSIALAYQHIEKENRTMNEPDYTHKSSPVRYLESARISVPPKKRFEVVSAELRLRFSSDGASRTFAKRPGHAPLWS